MGKQFNLNIFQISTKMLMIRVLVFHTFVFFLDKARADTTLAKHPVR